MAIRITTTTDSPEELQQVLDSDPRSADPPEADATGQPGPDAEGTDTEGGEGEPDAGAGTNEPLAPKHPKSAAQKRIDRLRYEKGQVQRDNERLRADLDRATADIARIRSERPGAPAGDKPVEPPKFSKPKPSVDKYDDIEKYSADLEQWATEKAAFDSSNRVTVEPDSVREQREILARHQSRIEKFRETHADFDAVAQQAIKEQVPITPLMLAHISQTDLGPDIMYYLAKHGDEAREIAKMPAGKMWATLGRIEERLDRENKSRANSGNGGNPKPKIVPKVPVTVTPHPDSPRPPAPVTPVVGSSRATKSVENMSQKEYNAWRARGGGSR